MNADSDLKQRDGTTAPRRAGTFQFVPDRLIQEYANDPLALAVWTVVALATYRARGAVTISATDLATLDGTPTAPHRVAIMRRLQKLIKRGWLIPDTEVSVHKYALRPTWGCDRAGVPYVWDFTSADHGRPQWMRARRVPTTLIDDGIGRITPQMHGSMLIARERGVPLLSFIDLGTYIRALRFHTPATAQLAALGLVRDGQAHWVTLLPSLSPTATLPQNTNAYATITLTGTYTTLVPIVDGVCLHMHTPSDDDPFRPVMSTDYTVYVADALWWPAAATAPGAVLHITGIPFIDRVTDPLQPQLAVRATALRSAPRSAGEAPMAPPIITDGTDNNHLYPARLLAGPLIGSEDPEKQTNQPPPQDAHQRLVNVPEEGLSDHAAPPDPEPYLPLCNIQEANISCNQRETSNNVLDSDVRVGHLRLNPTRTIGRGEWYELVLLQQEHGPERLLLWQERAMRRQYMIERLVPAYYHACAAADAREAPQPARVRRQRTHPHAQVHPEPFPVAAPPAPGLPSIGEDLPAHAPACANVPRAVSTPSRWRHPDPACAQALREMGIVAQGELADVDPALIFAWQPYANHVGLQHEKRNVAGYLFTALRAGRAPDPTELNTLAHKWGGSLDPADNPGSNTVLQAEATRSFLAVIGRVQPNAPAEVAYGS